MRKRFVILAIMLLSLPVCAVGATARSTPPLRIPLHELPNGFRYALAPSAVPKERLYFRLIINTGSQQEHPGEEGAAHFIEHLAFRASAHYPDGELVHRLEALGEQYGRTINAFTGYDRTVYIYSLPAGTDPNARLRLGVHIAHEWLRHIRFTDSLLRSERRVILEEIAQYSEGNPCLELPKKGSNPALQRLPIASPEQVKRLRVEALQHYYQRNYRPENASLIISGNPLDTAYAVELLSVFAREKGYPSARIQAPPLVYSQRNHFCPGDAPELEYIIPHSQPEALSPDQLLHDRLAQLALGVANQRLHAKGLPCSLSLHWYLNQTRHLSLSAKPSDSLSMEVVLAQSAATVAGLAKTSVSPGEWRDALAEERARLRNYGYPSTAPQLMDYYTDIALTHTRGMQSPKEYEGILSRIEALPPKSLKPYFSQILHWLKADTAVLLLRDSLDSKDFQPSRFAPLRRAIVEGLSHPDTCVPTPRAELHPRSSPADFSLPPLPSPPQKTRNAPEGHSYYPQLNLHEWTLASGVKLILRQTTNSDSIVSVDLRFRGGLSAAPNRLYAEYESTVSYLTMGGIEGLPYDAYRDYLLNHGISLTHTMGNYYHGLLAMSPRRELPALCRAIYGSCFHPELLPDDFEEIRQELLKELDERGASSPRIAPIHLLARQVDTLTGQIPFPLGALSRAFLDTITLTDYARHYRQLYTQNHQLQCIVTGPIPPDEALRTFRPLLLMYREAGRIAAEAQRTEALPRLPHTLRIPTDYDTARINFHYIVPFKLPTGQKGDLIGKLIRDLAREEFLRQARLQQGLVYSPYVDVRISKRNPSYAFLDLQAEIATRNRASIVRILSRLLEALLSPRVLANLPAHKRAFLLNRSEGLLPDARNAWRDYIDRMLTQGVTLPEMEAYARILQSISPEDVARTLSTTGQGAFVYIGGGSPSPH